MEEMFSRGWTELVARDSGPLHVRLLLQPLVAAVLAIRSGVKDARGERPIFFWTVILEPAQRWSLIRQLWKDVGKLFVMAAALDVAYQMIVLRRVYPVQTLIVATGLAIFPYLVFRGVANRMARRNGLNQFPNEHEGQGGRDRA